MLISALLVLKTHDALRETKVPFCCNKVCQLVSVAVSADISIKTADCCLFVLPCSSVCGHKGKGSSVLMKHKGKSVKLVVPGVQ